MTEIVEIDKDTISFTVVDNNITLDINTSVIALEASSVGPQGIQGIQGPDGDTGPQGPPGAGIAPGGTTGQLLQKTSSAVDYATGWVDVASLNTNATQVHVYVKNGSGQALTKGQAVYIFGAEGANPLIRLAQANSEATSSKTLGLLEQDLAVNAFGYVACEGAITGVNTGLAQDGDLVWLSPTTAGGLVYGLANKPSAPNHMVFIGYVLRAQSQNGVIYVKPQNGFELEELHNVAISSPATGQTITYNQTTGLWSNSGVSPSGNAGGELTGTYPNPTLASLSPSPAGTYGSASVVPRITLDAQGRTTSVTNTNIAINGTAIDNASITASKLANYATAPSYYYAVAGASYVTLVSGNLPANFTYSPYGTTNTPLTTGVALPAIAQTYYIQGYTQFTFGTKATGTLSFQISGTNLASYDVSLFWSNFTGSGAQTTSATRLADTISTGSTAILYTSTTQQAHIIEFKGIIRTNGSAATVLPTVSSTTGTTAGAGLRVYGGSYIMLTPITDASTNTIGTWS